MLPLFLKKKNQSLMKKLIVLNRVKCAWEYARFQCSILVLVAFYVFESSRTIIMKVEANGAWNNPLVSNKSPWLLYTTSTAQIFSCLSASFSSQWWRYLVLGDWSEGFIMQEQNGGSLLWYSSYDPDTRNDKCNITFVLLKLANMNHIIVAFRWMLIDTYSIIRALHEPIANSYNRQAAFHFRYCC